MHPAISDASKLGIGAVLKQPQFENIFHPIGLANILVFPFTNMSLEAISRVFLFVNILNNIIVT